MSETIYGDVLFLINFSMDFLSLFITEKILHLRAKPYRILISAVIGGIYGVAALFFDVSSAVLTGLNILCAATMCFVAFFAKRISGVFAACAVFYACGMLLGGIMTAIYSKLGRYTGYISMGGGLATVFGEIPMWLFCALAAVSAAVTYLFGRLTSRKRSNETVKIIIGFDGKTAEICCLCDSANLLREPISSLPVIFISEREAGFIPEKLLLAMKSGGITDDEKTMARLRFAPSSTVTGGGVVVCVRPDVCTVGGENKNALVAVDFSGNSFGGFGGLAPKLLI